MLFPFRGRGQWTKCRYRQIPTPFVPSNGHRFPLRRLLWPHVSLLPLHQLRAVPALRHLVHRGNVAHRSRDGLHGALTERAIRISVDLRRPAGGSRDCILAARAQSKLARSGHPVRHRAVCAHRVVQARLDSKILACRNSHTGDSGVGGNAAVGRTLAAFLPPGDSLVAPGSVFKPQMPHALPVPPDQP